MKIRIVGPCGSGKSYAAWILSGIYEIKYYEIDDMVWKRGAEDTRYELEERNGKLAKVVEMDNWIIEGAQSALWVVDSFEKADIIFVLKPNVYLTDFRVIIRFLQDKLGIKKMNYNQSLSQLKKMIVDWNHGYNFEVVKIAVKGMEDKVHWVKSLQDMIEIIEWYYCKR